MGLTLFSILPEVKKQLSQAPFIIELLNRLAFADQQKRLRHEIVQNGFKDILFNFAQEFSLSKSITLTKKARPSSGGCSIYGLGNRNQKNDLELEPTHTVSAYELAQLIGHCLTVGDSESEEKILSTIQGEVETFERVSLGLLMLPFLLTLTHVLRSHGVWVSNPRYREFYTKIVGICVDRCVENRPSAPSDWKRRQVSCTCYDCQWLNAFLEDPRAKTNSFCAAEKRRKHLESQLYSRGAITTVDRSHGTPYTLIITKNDGDYQTDLRDWERNREAAASNIESLGFDNLRQIFIATSGLEIIKQLSGESTSKQSQRPALAALPQGSWPTSAFPEHGGGVQPWPAGRKLPPLDASGSGENKNNAKGTNTGAPEIIDLT